MNDVDRLILEAWQKLGPKIMRDPQQLERRLVRRRSALLTRPPRAWCLAIRASDRRITPAHWVISPEHALDLTHPAHPYEPIEHEVTIRPHALRKNCRPVRTDSWGELVPEVCKKLGTTPRGVSNGRWAGLFAERYVKRLGGKPGKPQPLIHSWTTLDPSGTNHFAKPDSLWGSLWEFLPDMIPDDFEQTITRIPIFRPFGTTAVAPVPPDHVFADDVQLVGYRWICPGCKKQVSKIYYPLPPNTLFDFLGYDPANYLHLSPISPSPRYSGERVGVRGSSLDVESSKLDVERCRGNSPNPQPQIPNPPWNPPHKTPPKNSLRYDLHHLDPPPPTFACQRCHRIRYFPRTTKNGWNEIVSTLTRGLLFGHEVPAPAWYRTSRLRPRTRQLHRPSPKRDAIFDHLQLGHTIDQIALDLLISTNAVRCNLRLICLQHGVKTRQQLAKKLNWKSPQPDTIRQQIRDRAKQRESQIEHLLLQDLTYQQIATRLRITFACLDRAVRRIYKRHNLPSRAGRKALAEKLGALLPGRHAINREFRQRLLAGQSDREIATAMNLTLIAVGSRIKKLIKTEGVKGRKGLFEKYSKDSYVGAASAAV